MPPLDFPASPITGATYAGPGGVLWVWDGSKWANGTTIGTAYAPIQSPVFTGNPTAPNPPSGDADTSIATTAFVAPAFNGVGRNLIQNPLMAVAQRGAGPWTTFGSYTADRWLVNGNTDTLSISVATAGDAHRAVIGDETCTRLLGYAFSGSAVAGAFSVLQQSVEGVMRLAGKTVTLSFWVAGNVSMKLGVNYLQNFGTGGSPSSGVWALATGASLTIGTAWTRYSVTTTLPSAAGKTLGTSGNDCTTLAIAVSSGSGNNTLFGNVGVQSGSINLWGVQLEVGSVATPLDYGGSPQQQLAECQRFYQTFTGLSMMASTTAASQLFGQSLLFPVAMRAAPTVNLTGQAYSGASGLVAANVSQQSMLLYATSSITTSAQWTTNMVASADL